MDAWINGGFFVFDRRVFGYLDDDSVLERDPLERLAQDGELVAYRHDGFWACMDTYKDNLDLNSMWAAGKAPWRTWEQ
jgi:glucose-1-phosphate cytidylyltransferase